MGICAEYIANPTVNLAIAIDPNRIRCLVSSVLKHSGNLDERRGLTRFGCVG